VLYGSILGDVKDSTEASVPGANVVITNKNTGLDPRDGHRHRGHFNFPDVPAGVYAVKISQQGFKTVERSEVNVSINSVTRVDVALEVGAMGETVTVNAEPPKLQTDTAEVHSSIVATDLQNLPVPLGRNYQQMFRMLPGFAPPANSHSIPTNPARSLEFTVNGTSDDTNNTRIDGVSTAHVQLPHVVSYIPTLESIEGSEHRHQQHGRGTGAGRRRGDQRADAQRDERHARVGLRVLHQPAPEGLADAVR
jgi:hypothetical protein